MKSFAHYLTSSLEFGPTDQLAALSFDVESQFRIRRNVAERASRPEPKTFFPPAYHVVKGRSANWVSVLIPAVLQPFF
jgi:hypothetical protein